MRHTTPLFFVFLFLLLLQKARCILRTFQDVQHGVGEVGCNCSSTCSAVRDSHTGAGLCGIHLGGMWHQECVPSEQTG